MTNNCLQTQVSLVSKHIKVEAKNLTDSLKILTERIGDELKAQALRIGGGLSCYAKDAMKGKHLNVSCGMVCSLGSFDDRYELFYLADGDVFLLSDGETFNVLKYGI